jgi:hypothetical protein
MKHEYKKLHQSGGFLCIGCGKCDLKLGNERFGGNAKNRVPSPFCHSLVRRVVSTLQQQRVHDLSGLEMLTES